MCGVEGGVVWRLGVRPGDGLEHWGDTNGAWGEVNASFRGFGLFCFAFGVWASLLS